MKWLYTVRFKTVENHDSDSLAVKLDSLSLQVTLVCDGDFFFMSNDFLSILHQVVESLLDCVCVCVFRYRFFGKL